MHNDCRVTLKRIPTKADLDRVGFSGSAYSYQSDIDLINQDIMPACDGKTIVTYQTDGEDCEMSGNIAIVWFEQWYLPAYLFNIEHIAR